MFGLVLVLIYSAVNSPSFGPADVSHGGKGIGIGYWKKSGFICIGIVASNVLQKRKIQKYEKLDRRTQLSVQ